MGQDSLKYGKTPVKNEQDPFETGIIPIETVRTWKDVGAPEKGAENS